MDALKGSVGTMATELGVALIPVINQMVSAFQAVMPILKTLLRVVLPPLVNILGIFANSLKFVAAVLTGDWQGAWKAARDIAVGAITHFVNVYNNTLAKLPGMPEIDVSKLTASLTSAEDSMEDTGHSGYRNGDRGRHSGHYIRYGDGTSPNGGRGYCRACPECFRWPSLKPTVQALTGWRN